MIKAIFFDLDGTLLPMDLSEFLKTYLGMLGKKMEKYGYEKNKLVDTLMTGTNMMVKNDGSRTNYDLFWDYFVSIYGEDKLKDRPLFDSFYSDEFKKTIIATKPNKLAWDIVNFCKNNFDKVILATNPFFPSIAVETRLNFIDLSMKDFDFVTTYENSSVCKPNPAYFKWLLEKFNLKPEEVIMIGNDNSDDASCSQLGIKCYLVNSTMIINPNIKYEYEVINMEEVIPTLKTYLSE